MFEKEAEEIANKRCHEIMCFGHCSFSSPKHHRCGEWHREYNCAKEGAEFGYNKANEMHDLRKDPNDLPKGQINRFLFAYVKNYGGKKPMLVCYNGEWFYDANTYNDEVKVIQWCEIPQFKE